MQWRERTEEETKCHLIFRGDIYYEKYKNRNPDRVPLTGEWVLSHKTFIRWRKERHASILWISAYPGCGKSVLSKALVEDAGLVSVNPAKAAVCYFFFKDDSTIQQSAANALSALLHQLFSQKIALITHAIGDFRPNGEKLTKLFSTMWNILESAAADSGAGEIICVLDALDECEEESRLELIDTLRKFYSSPRKSETRLKFLVTSRPYLDIERAFQTLVDDTPMRIEGEHETEAIGKEIDLVIEATVPILGIKLHLNPTTQEFLKNHLLGISNRTYLWLHMIFHEIEHSFGVTTPKRLTELIKKLPEDVPQAYERILSRIQPKYLAQAKRLLHLIVAANRPLSLREMNVALAINEGMRSYQDLGTLEDEHNFQYTITNLCGLFINVIDSKIYLIHQSAKEFLVPNHNDKPTHASGKDIVVLHDPDSIEPQPSKPEPSQETAATADGIEHQPPWENSLEPRTSNFIMARACISYLLFDTFESHPLIIDPKTPVFNVVTLVDKYTQKHDFLEYAAKHWALHFRDGKISTKPTMQKFALELCNAESKRFNTWFQIYWTSVESIDSNWVYLDYADKCPQGFNDLTIASCFGIDVAVQALLKSGANVHTRDQLGYTALHWAARFGHDSVVNLLLDNDAEIKAGTGWQKTGNIALHLAAEHGHHAVVETILDKGADVDAKNGGLKSATPLHHAVIRGHHKMIQLLVGRKANVDAKDINGESVSFYATRRNDEWALKLLLENGADINAKENNGQRPITYAWSEAVLQLLIENWREFDKSDYYAQQAMETAAKNGYEEVLRLLLERGVDVNCYLGRSGLRSAVIAGHEGVVRLLLEKGADVMRQDEEGLTVLCHAARTGEEAITRLVLEHCDVNSKPNSEKWLATTRLCKAAASGDYDLVRQLLETNVKGEWLSVYGATALHRAVVNGQKEIVELLIEHGTNINAANAEGFSALHLATRAGNKAIVQLLIEKKIKMELRGRFRQTALHEAIRYGHREVALELLESGANIEAESANSWTPLQWAAKYGQEAVAELLLQRKCDIEAGCNGKYGPLYMAIEYGMPGVVRLLLNWGANATLFRAEQVPIDSYRRRAEFQAAAQVFKDWQNEHGIIMS